MNNIRKYYFKAPTDFTDSLKRSGKREKARAFWEFCDDISNSEKNTDRFYAESWGISKTGARNWMKEFEIELNRFNDFWELENLRVKNLSDQKKTGELPKNDQKNSSKTPELPKNGGVDETKEKPKSDQKKTEDINKNIKINLKKEKEKLTLPPCIPFEIWDQWVSYRSDCNLTNNNKTLLAQAKKLEEWFNEGYEPSEIINSAILNGWKSVFEPRKSTSKALTMGQQSQNSPWVQEKLDARRRGESLNLAIIESGFDNYLDYVASLSDSI